MSLCLDGSGMKLRLCGLMPLLTAFCLSFGGQLTKLSLYSLCAIIQPVLCPSLPFGGGRRKACMYVLKREIWAEIKQRKLICKRMRSIRREGWPSEA